MYTENLKTLPECVEIPVNESGLTLKLNLIRRGSFLMGSRGYFMTEEPVHKVTIPFDFYLGVFPVTQCQYSVWARLNDVKTDWFLSEGQNHPAYSVDWFSVNQFCQWLGKCWQEFTESQGDGIDQLCKSMQVSLPSEAQWEYACSAWLQAEGEHTEDRVCTEYHSGDSQVALSLAGWYGLNSSGKTHDVGLKQPNRHGLFDMHGNVSELCRDDWRSDSYCYQPNVSVNPVSQNKQQLTRGPAHVIRGGSCLSSASDCRAASRRLLPPVTRPGMHGFRVGLFPA